MRNRCAERRFAARPFDVDVDPLMVASGVGELVDAFLRDFQPVAHHDFLARLPGELFETAEHDPRHYFLLCTA